MPPSAPRIHCWRRRNRLTNFDHYLPQETLSFSVHAGPDLSALYQFLEDTVRNFGPKGDELFAGWEQLQASFGVNVRKDVVDWIDGDFISATLDDGMGSVWFIKVKDEGVAREKVGRGRRIPRYAASRTRGAEPHAGHVRVHALARGRRAARGL